MTIYCYDDGSKGSSPLLASAFADGFGGKVTQSRELLDGDVALFGSPVIWDSVIQKAIKENRTWYYADHAYINRGRYYRVTKNRYQHTGEGDSNGKRLKAHGIEIKPWRTGAHIVVCPPDEVFARLMGIDATEWTERARQKLAEATDRPIIWRDRLGHKKQLTADLANAHALVTFMSNAAVEAIIDGIPVFCNGPCAAQSMGKPDFSEIEYPIYPDDRQRFLGVLADNQWTLDEIRSGQCKAWLDGHM